MNIMKISSRLMVNGLTVATLVIVLAAGAFAFVPSNVFAADLGDEDGAYGMGGGYYGEEEMYDEEEGGYWGEEEMYNEEEGGYWGEEEMYDEGGYDDYGYGGSFGGGSTGGGYYMYPSIYSPKQYTTPSNPTTITNTNTNNNTNVNVNNNTAIAVAQVQIGSQQATYPTPTYAAPYCTIYQAQYNSYNSYGTNQVYLSWSSSNASSAYLSGYGSVAVNGSQTVYTSGTQNYTLTVYGYNGQQATCQTTVYMNSAPYVSLTQIPYTGFDFGPFGNAMYWAGMIVFALTGAYLAVYFIPSLAFAGFSKRSYAPVVAPKAPILAEKEAALANVAPIVASIKKSGTNDAMAIVKSSDGSMPKIVIERY